MRLFAAVKTSYLILIICALALFACDLTTTTPTPSQPFPTFTESPSPTDTSQTTLEPSATPIPGTPLPSDFIFEDFPADVNPLTGLQVADPSILERRPVAVKISNYPRSIRPQWGLSLADIVYEYYHNNDLTRFYAIFYGQNAELAGPIRSGRLFDSYLTDIYQDVLVFASADPRVLDRLNAEHPAWQLVPLLDGACPPRPVCRLNPETTNFLVANTVAVGNFAAASGGDNQRKDLHGMAFSADVPESGQPVLHINMYYSYAAYSYWEYDENSGRYLRFQDTRDDVGARGEAYAPLMDRLTGQQVAADNVVVLYIDHFHSFYSHETETDPVIEIVDMDFSGHAPAYAFRDGQVYSLEWVREKGELLYLVDSNGQRFPFKPGTTWFQVVTDETQLISDESTWRYEFIFRRPE